MREEYDFSKGIKNPFADDCKINLFFKSVIDQDRAAVVICNLDHVIVYMVALRDDSGTLIGYYEKHEYRDRETMERYDYGD